MNNNEENESLVLHHVAIAVKDIAAVIDYFALSLGAKWDGEISHDPEQRAKVAFLSPINGLLGAPHIELIQADHSTAPLARFVANGGGLHHLCYEVVNLEVRLAHMRAQGAIIVKKPTPALAFAGRRIAWVYTRQRLLLEYLENGHTT